jgi:glycine/D-amino acid oxidase-like deaminating enzyme
MTHVAVVGAGILGAALADQLARRGAAVTLVDSRDPASGTSGASFAWLNANRKPPRAYHDLTARGMAEWRSLAAELGDPLWYKPVGSLAWGDLTDRVKRLRDWDYPVEEITAARAAELEPGLRLPAGAHVAHFPTEAYLHGAEAVEALVARARSHGAVLARTQGDVTLAEDGLRSPAGEHITADIYVSCAGWRTPALLGDGFPMVDPTAADSTAPCLVSHVPGRSPLSRVVIGPGIEMRPGSTSGLQLGGGLLDLDTPADKVDRLGEELVKQAATVLPDLTPDGAEHRVCVRPLPSDGLPVVGFYPAAAASTYAIVTHSGITLAPLLARLVADELLTGDPSAELAPYRPDRFS